MTQFLDKKWPPRWKPNKDSKSTAQSIALPIKKQRSVNIKSYFRQFNLLGEIFLRNSSTGECWIILCEFYKTALNLFFYKNFRMISLWLCKRNPLAWIKQIFNVLSMQFNFSAHYRKELFQSEWFLTFSRIQFIGLHWM